MSSGHAGALGAAIMMSLLLLLRSASAVNSGDLATSDVINVNFVGEPDGIEISAIWKPSIVQCSGDIRGTAIIDFKRLRDGKSFSTSVDDISFSNHLKASGDAQISETELAGFYNGGIIHFDLSKSEQERQVTCGNGKDICLGLGYSPISFVDVTFNGKPEIAFRHECNGQRGGDTFTFQELPSLDEDLWELSPPFQSTLNYEPFLSFDIQSEINLTRKEITNQSSGGACIFQNRTYALSDADYSEQFVLSKIVEYDTKKTPSEEDRFWATDCYRYEYKAMKLGASYGIQSFELISKQIWDDGTNVFIDIK
ncbi:MAG: hypothetical protein ACI92A_001360 [Candidatus Paceibacteria bacterium]|jgi:hypothetical protein